MVKFILTCSSRKMDNPFWPKLIPGNFLVVWWTTCLLEPSFHSSGIYIKVCSMWLCLFICKSNIDCLIIFFISCTLYCIYNLYQNYVQNLYKYSKKICYFARIFQPRDDTKMTIPPILWNSTVFIECHRIGGIVDLMLSLDLKICAKYHIFSLHL